MITNRQRLSEALKSDDHATDVHYLAKALRDEGMCQVDLFKLFAEFQKECDPNDPTYDSIVDTMDLIWGGPWAKGGQFYEHELKSTDIQ